MSAMWEYFYSGKKHNPTNKTLMFFGMLLEFILLELSPVRLGLMWRFVGALSTPASSLGA